MAEQPQLPRRYTDRHGGTWQVPVELTERYRAAYGTGPEAAAFLRGIADEWEQTSQRYEAAGPHWNDALDGGGHASDPADCCDPQ